MCINEEKSLTVKGIRSGSIEYLVRLLRVNRFTLNLEYTRINIDFYRFEKRTVDGELIVVCLNLKRGDAKNHTQVVIRSIDKALIEVLQIKCETAVLDSEIDLDTISPNQFYQWLGIVYDSVEDKDFVLYPALFDGNGKLFLNKGMNKYLPTAATDTLTEVVAKMTAKEFLEFTGELYKVWQNGQK